ncbi:MAG: PstS family phosphate ABC transporter substrate-binding protein [Elainellaceae cyanobacterium]
MQKNDTPALIATLLFTVGLIGAGIWWVTQQVNVDLGNVIRRQQATSQSTSSTSTPTGNRLSDSQVPSGLFNYGGSTTWAPIRGSVDQAIQQAHPQFQLRYTNPTNAAPGSGTGIQMLLDNQLSFAQSSRSLSADEYQAAQQRGFALKEIPVALEGIAIAVHPDLDVPGLTLNQLNDIYTGQITNWSQVGGPNLAIVPYSRREDGGTVEFFISNILGGADFSNSVQFLPTTTQALRAVSSTPGGIYYASAPEVIGQCTTKPLPIGIQPNQWVAPYQEPLVPTSQCPAQRNQINTAVLQSGAYPITRRLFVIVKVNDQIDQEAGEAYATLLLSNEGQELLNQAGFVRIR